MESERLMIRHFQLEDAERIYELAKDPDVGIHAGWPAHKSIEETKEIIENILMKEDNFAIVEKESGLLIGACGLQKDPFRGNPLSQTLGYWIGKEYWGKGYMKEASLLVMDYGFKKLGISLIGINCFSYNNRSKSVIEKLGFHYEGEIRGCTLRFDGTILNNLSYSITKEEFYDIYKNLIEKTNI